MKKEISTEKRKKSYWWIIILVLFVIAYAYITNQPEEEKSFVVNAFGSWYACWDDTSNININYEISSSSPVNLFFTPTNNDAKSLNETAQYYPSCYSPNILSDAGDCAIAGKGCMVLLNKNINNAIVSLKYSARKIE